jgi:NitT/TauT family transport system ATP-binding protein
LEDIDVTALLGSQRTLSLRDSQDFFQLKTRVLQAVRAANAESL